MSTWGGDRWDLSHFPGQVRTVRAVSSEDHEIGKYDETMSKALRKGVRDATIGTPLRRPFNRHLDLPVTQAAAPGNPGGSLVRPRLQPQATQAATPRVPGCYPRVSGHYPAHPMLLP